MVSSGSKHCVELRKINNCLFTFPAWLTFGSGGGVTSAIQSSSAFIHPVTPDSLQNCVVGWEEKDDGNAMLSPKDHFDGLYKQVDIVLPHHMNHIDHGFRNHNTSTDPSDY